MPRWIFRAQPADDVRWAVLFLTDADVAKLHELVRAVSSLDVAALASFSSAEWYGELPFDMPEPEIVERVDRPSHREVDPIRVELSQIDVSRTGFSLSCVTASGVRVSTEEVELVETKPRPVLPRVRVWDDVEWGLKQRGDETILTVGVWFDIDPAGEIPVALVEIPAEREAKIRGAIDALRELLKHR
jgi:hypothetical protein